jgi:vacuolar-type H+-ATPase subunit H
VEEKLVEDIEFHRQTVASDDNSPLHLIREKEMEISGRVLTAKREADEIVANARKEAASMVAAAQDEAAAKAGERDAAVKVDMERKSAEIRAESEREAAALEETIKARRDEAVRHVMDSVITV